MRQAARLLESEVDVVGDVEAFHEKFGLRYQGKPRVLPKDLADFRLKFHKEELEEYKKHHYRAEYDVQFRPGCDVVGHLEEMLDACVDLVYVVVGTSDYHGFNFREAWRRVHAANMQKVRAERAEDSKRGSLYDVVKPPGWQAPNHHDLVEDHAHKEKP